MHIDQNEKLIRFGVTHVAASDGYSNTFYFLVRIFISTTTTVSINDVV